jgi:predicted metal-binding membrane protein
MKKLQKLITIALFTTAGFSWLLSALLPDMMDLMTSYNPVLILLFTASWTAGMAAMMFLAIVPMVLLYNRLITNEESGSSTVVTQRKLRHIFKVILFVGMYLVIWAMTGIALLLSWSVPMNSLIMGMENNHIGMIFGSILIISGVYQFTSLKNKCIGYCESPLSFFMRRWEKGTLGAIKMGVLHGLYCLGCCWPYFLIMVALGWMNLAWMGLFALIIFGEKIWSKGIWIARAVGIALIILGASSSVGLIVVHDSTMDMNMIKQEMERDNMDMDMSLQDKTSPIVTGMLNGNTNTLDDSHPIMPERLSM